MTRNESNNIDKRQEAEEEKKVEKKEENNNKTSSAGAKGSGTPLSRQIWAVQASGGRGPWHHAGVTRLPGRRRIAKEREWWVPVAKERGHGARHDPAKELWIKD